MPASSSSKDLDEMVNVNWSGALGTGNRAVWSRTGILPTGVCWMNSISSMLMGVPENACNSSSI
ncbi:MAG: hypothetical protein OXK74_14245 [Gemmatimonadota bacterium]|nr:hypothetical protein [Gemmatimonadota bacterium]